jgi:hypothetical protein
VAKPFDATLNSLIDARPEDWVVRLWLESADALLAGGPTTAPLAMLTDEAASDLDGVFERFAHRLRQPDVDGKLAKDLFGSTYVLCGCATIPSGSPPCTGASV